MFMRGGLVVDLLVVVAACQSRQEFLWARGGSVRIGARGCRSGRGGGITRWRGAKADARPACRATHVHQMAGDRPLSCAAPSRRAPCRRNPGRDRCMRVPVCPIVRVLLVPNLALDLAQCSL